MNIYLADFHFETNLGGKKPFIKIIPDVVTIKIPLTHIHRKSDLVERAIRGLSITELKMLVKNRSGKYKVKVIYTKKIGTTNG